jgi:hypothetical protein
VIARPGVFVFSELALAHPPLAHSIHASGLVNIFVYARELAPAHPPLAHSIHASGLVNIFVYPTELAPTNPPVAFAVTPPGGLDDVLRTSAMGTGGFCFYSSMVRTTGTGVRTDFVAKSSLSREGHWTG